MADGCKLRRLMIDVTLWNFKKPSMIKIAVLGAGMIGTAIAIDLAKTFDVTSVDINENSLSRLQQTNKNISTIKSDLANYKNYEELLKPFDFIITTVPGFIGYKTLEAVITAKKNVVDISFSPENILDLDTLAKENNVTAIVDCGVAPGMSNLILGYYNQLMKIDSFECVVGGLPNMIIKQKLHQWHEQQATPAMPAYICSSTIYLMKKGCFLLSW